MGGLPGSLKLVRSMPETRYTATWSSWCHLGAIGNTRGNITGNIIGTATTDKELHQLRMIPDDLPYFRGQRWDWMTVGFIRAFIGSDCPPGPRRSRKGQFSWFELVHDKSPDTLSRFVISKLRMFPGLIAMWLWCWPLLLFHTSPPTRHEQELQWITDLNTDKPSKTCHWKQVVLYPRSSTSVIGASIFVFYLVVYTVIDDRCMYVSECIDMAWHGCGNWV